MLFVLALLIKVGFTPVEIREYLATDPDVRILIVEGVSDISAWRYIIPDRERVNCVVYSIDEFDVARDHFGNRGAALRFAAECISWIQAGRIRVFIDADNDRQLGVSHPENVTLTDYRDLEAYVLLENIFKHLCLIGLGESASEFDVTKSATCKLLRPLGILRIASERHFLDLPFQATFEEGSVKRFFRKRGRDYSLVTASLLQAILNKAGRPHSDQQIITSALDAETTTLASVADIDIIHGKDLVSFLSWYFTIPLPVAAGILHMAIGAQINEVRDQPNVRATYDWLLAA